MREILFRGECVETGDWVKGFYVRLYDERSRETHRIYPGYAETDCGDYYPDVYEVDPKTVGQFTGLTDKNGKKIFEGDIVEYTSYTGTGIKEVKRAVVFWDEHRWSYKVIYNNRWTAQWNNKGHTCDVYKSTVSKYGEVIGNIHDNPKLWEAAV